MHQTVIGVFATHAAAENARDRLVDRGFDASHISIKNADAARGGPARAADSREDEGVMASIGRFFSDLFGAGDDGYAGHYAEAVRRGHVVLTVEADNSALDAAQDVLSAAGAIDIDERVSSWRGQGWDGFDPGLAPFDSHEAEAERAAVARSHRGATAGLDRERPSSIEADDAGRSGMAAAATGMPGVDERDAVGRRVRVVARAPSGPADRRSEGAVVENRPPERSASGVGTEPNRDMGDSKPLSGPRG